MSGDRLTTQLARPTDDPATTVRATWYVVRTGNADVLTALGLGTPALHAALGVTDEPARPAADKPVLGDCPVCGNQPPGHGVCRRRETCREAARARGWSA